MKNIYSKIFLLSLLFILQLYFPVRLSAQCLCAGGIAATAQTQSVTIAPTASSNLNFTFQKFDPAVGTLSCLAFTDTISGISYSGARNTNKGNYHIGAVEYVDSTNFRFALSLPSEIKGPAGSGIDITQDFDTTFGFNKLKSMDTILNLPGDTITYGPTNFIAAPTGSATVGGPSSVYLGVGTIDFTYTVNGGMITKNGGANYKSSVTSIIGGKLTLTYYYCPNALLASGLQNFSAYKNNNNIALKWDAQNAADINQYNIEYSVDGITFTDIATINGTHSATTSTYNYNYALNGSSAGYMYFRIKQIGNDGKTAYSAIQKILLTGKTGIAVTIRPNPVTTGMSIAFDHPLNGDYSVDLVNLAGQVIVSKKMNLANSNVIPVNWSSKPASGIYFTRITNTASMEQQIVRVVVQ